MDPPTDWTDTSQHYTTRLKPSTSRLADEIVTLSNSLLPYTSTSRVLDNGCGPGTVTTALKDRYPDIPVLATDYAQGMLNKVNELNISDVSTMQVNAMDLSPLLGKKFSHVFSNFMLQFTPSQFQPITEMIKVVNEGGVLGISTWGEGFDAKVIELSARITYPNFKAPSVWATNLFPENATQLKKLYQKIGLENVSVETSYASFSHASYEDYEEYIFSGDHPSFRKQLDALRSFAGDEGVKAARSNLLTVVREQGVDIRDLRLTAFLAVGMKPVGWEDRFDLDEWIEE